jgi:hypothetical protein
MPSTVKVLMTYFGKKEGQSLPDFAAELKALSPEEKKELAEGAAKELGVELTE